MAKKEANFDLYIYDLLKEASKEVQQSANAVRGYPVEVISKGTTRMEQYLLQCEQSAKKASLVYEEAKTLVTKSEKYMLTYMPIWTLASSLIVGVLIGIILIWFFRR